MRAIALAIILSSWGIEQAIRGNAVQSEYPGLYGFLSCVFLACLVFGW